MQYVALFLLWPFLEIALFTRIGAAFGGTAVIGLCVLSAVAGFFLIQMQGLKTMALLRRVTASGEVPGQEIFDGLCYFIAGVLLIIPGFCSDFLAICLLVPPVRAILRRRLAPVSMHKGGSSQSPAGTPDYIIEGEFTRVDDRDTSLTHPDSKKPE